MDTNALKRFAQEARQNLKKIITSKLKFVLDHVPNPYGSAHAFRPARV